MNLPNNDSGHIRITQVTEQLQEKIDYLCKEYNLHCAEMIGILNCIAYDIWEDNTIDRE